MRLQVACGISIPIPLEETRSRGHTQNCKGARAPEMCHARMAKWAEALFQWTVEWGAAPCTDGDVPWSMVACPERQPLLAGVLESSLHSLLLGLGQIYT